MMRAVPAVLAVAALLAACAVGPQYQRPELDVPADFRGQEQEQGQAQSGASLADLDWAQMYQDQTLQQLLRVALDQNRDLRIAAARVAEARAQVGISQFAQLPQIDVGLGGQRSGGAHGLGVTTGNVFSAQAQASYEIDLWRRLASLTDAARARLLATDYAGASVRMTLVSDVATAYFSLLALDQQFLITRRTVASRERFVQLTQLKFRRGVASGLDANRAEASLALARANLPDLERQIAQAENQLQILLGQNPAAIIRQRIDLQSIAMPLHVPAGLPSSLLERRPDVRAAEFDLVGTTADVRAARAALFPGISLTGAFGWESLELSSLFTGPARTWSFGLSLLQPLINSQRNAYQAEAARARQEQALLRYQGVVAQAFREVSDALAARRGFSEFASAQEQQVSALRQASSRVLRRYEIGYSSYFEVIDAETALFAAELQLVQAYRNNLVALVQLYRALGGGWNVRSGQP